MIDDLDEWNTTPKAKTPLNLMLPTVILPNYLGMAEIPTAHNTSVQYDVLHLSGTSTCYKWGFTS